jgi:hypothetical protein
MAGKIGARLCVSSFISTDQNDVKSDEEEEF